MRRRGAPGPAPAAACHGCRTCEEFRRAEAVARARGDHSKATDCRVLLRRHRGSGDCPAGEAG
ncbi:hypothetical protein L1885_02890 [Streptomyces fuscigenes]|nr:hypothetical protein [Streptomyces fuscigenes]MCF3960633.1 hypothetical protein [Streptomyces fuscigenes]